MSDDLLIAGVELKGYVTTLLETLNVTFGSTAPVSAVGCNFGHGQAPPRP